MGKRKEYWPNSVESGLRSGVVLEFRAELAFRLIERFGLVAGTRSEKEDSSGRSQLMLQTPEECVDRSFELANLFMIRAEKDGLIRLPLTEEAMAKRAGQLRKVVREAELDLDDWRQNKL